MKEEQESHPFREILATRAAVTFIRNEGICSFPLQSVHRFVRMSKQALQKQVKTEFRTDSWSSLAHAVRKLTRQPLSCKTV